jgi:hypothetical protein
VIGDVVIGDVSGKGCRRDDRVAAGGNDTALVHYTQSPREILAAMNQRMLARKPP